MHADLEHLIHLQELDLAAERARRRIDDLPAILQALDTRLAERAAVVTALKNRIAAGHTIRRELEKDLAAVQSRLSKFKSQLMEVKTNKEYQAMQKEMSVAEAEIREREDRLLEQMEESETLALELKTAEAALKAEQAEIARERQQLDAERGEIERELHRAVGERAAVAGKVSPEALSLFDYVARHRRGVALSEAREGHCTQCHVRMRPQVFNEVRRNDSLIQCDSCSRILYFVPTPTTDATASS